MSEEQPTALQQQMEKRNRDAEALSLLAEYREHEMKLRYPLGLKAHLRIATRIYDYFLKSLPIMPRRDYIHIHRRQNEANKTKAHKPLSTLEHGT